MNKTKRKIVEAAISLFNQHGIPNVRLQHIADECDISLGNLAYHFQLKENLIVFVSEFISADIEPLLQEWNDMPYLIDFDNLLSQYFNLINRYVFYFLDSTALENKYSNIHDQRVNHINQMVHQIFQWLWKNEERGILKKEIHEGQYQNLAQVIWMIVMFWRTQKKIRSLTGSEEEFKLIVWNQLIPIFTQPGLMEYEALILPQLANYKPEFY